MEELFILLMPYIFVIYTVLYAFFVCANVFDTHWFMDRKYLRIATVFWLLVFLLALIQWNLIWYNNIFF